MTKPKPASLESEYLLKVFHKKYPRMTLYEACKIAGISYETFYKSIYKHQTAFRSSKNLYLFCKFLGIKVEDVLLDRATDPERDQWKDKYLKLKEEHDLLLKKLNSIGLDLKHAAKKVPK